MNKSYEVASAVADFAPVSGRKSERKTADNTNFIRPQRQVGYCRRDVSAKHRLPVHLKHLT
jgi:hypothetical protein